MYQEREAIKNKTATIKFVIQKNIFFICCIVIVWYSYTINERIQWTVIFLLCIQGLISIFLYIQEKCKLHTEWLIGNNFRSKYTYNAWPFASNPTKNKTELLFSDAIFVLQNVTIPQKLPTKQWQTATTRTEHTT